MKKINTLLIKILLPFCFAAMFINYAQAQTDLVGHWAMEESSEVAVLTDSSTFSNNGNVTGSLVQTIAQRAYGQDFDGSNDYILVPDATSLDITNAITVAVWIKPAIVGTQRIIRKVDIGSNDGYSLFLSSSGYFSIKFNDDNGIRVNTSTSALYSDYLDQWIHIAATYDGTTIRTYFNGIPDNILASTFTIGTNNNALCLGARAEDGGNKFNGEMDDARVYNYALTPTEISDLLTTWSPPPIDNLVGHWAMHETTGLATLTDSSNYLNHASVSGSLTQVLGEIGYAQHFDGSNDYALVPDDPSLDITDKITIAAWIKPEIQGTQRIIRKVDGSTGYSLFLQNPSPSGISVRFNGNNAYRLNSTSSYLDHLNTWMHVVATYDGSMIRMYINGIKEDSLAAVFSIATNNLPLSIGAANDGNYKYTGAIDDARVYDRALTTGEIQDLAGDNYIPPFVYVPGYALDFDYTNDYVNCSNTTDFDFTTAMTLEAWIRPNIQGTLSIIKKNFNSTGYGLYCSATGTVYGRLDENNAYRAIATTAYPNDGSAWMHVALTYDGSDLKIYTNGELENTVYPGISIGTNTADLIIGSDAEDPGGTKNFDGQIDEVRIWNVARTQDDIKLDMYRELINPASETNLIAYYQFNENTGQTAFDASSNGHDATLGSSTAVDANDPTWVASTAPVPYFSVLDGNWDTDNTWATAQISPVKDWSRVLINTAVDVNVNETVQEATVNPSGALTVNSGNTLSVTDDFTIKSDLSEMGSFIDQGTLIVGGTSTVEQYITSEKWHLVSPPVSGATINTYFDIYLKEWNEPDSSWTFLVEPTTTLLNIGQGYAAWADDLYTGSTTVSFAGTLNTGDQSPSIEYTTAASHLGKGFNLIGNPFPSSIDWNSNWSMTDMSGWMVIYDNGLYRGQHTDGTDYNGKLDGLIPPTQGFWVRALNSSASITIPDSERLHSDQTFYKNSEDNSNPIIRLECEIAGYVDEAVLIFHPEGSPGFDGYYDLSEFMNVDEAPLLFTISGGDYYAVNFYEEEYNDQVIPVGFKTGAEGLYTITASDIANFDEQMNVYLEDLKTGVVTKLTETSNYDFTYDPLDVDHRFNLHFKVSYFGVEELPTGNINIYSINNVVYIQAPDFESAEVRVFDMIGQEIASKQVSESKLTKITIGSGTGYYLVYYQSDESLLTKKVFIK